MTEIFLMIIFTDTQNMFSNSQDLQVENHYCRASPKCKYKVIGHPNKTYATNEVMAVSY